MAGQGGLEGAAVRLVVEDPVGPVVITLGPVDGTEEAAPSAGGP